MTFPFQHFVCSQIYCTESAFVCTSGHNSTHKSQELCFWAAANSGHVNKMILLLSSSPSDNVLTTIQHSMRSGIVKSILCPHSPTADSQRYPLRLVSFWFGYDFNQPNKLTTVSKFKCSLVLPSSSRMSLQECQIVNLVLSCKVWESW